MRDFSGLRPRFPRWGMLAACLMGFSLLAAQDSYHVVEKGETLYSIARANGVSLEDLEKANSISDPSRVRLGTKLIIPQASKTSANPAQNPASPTQIPASSAQNPASPTQIPAIPAQNPAAPAQTTAPASQPSPVQTPGGATKTYKVLKGDTLFSIARTNAVSVAELRKINGLQSSSVLKIGDTLKIPASAPTAVSPGTAEKNVPKSSDQSSAAAKPASASSPEASGSAGAAPDPEPVKTLVKTVSKDIKWPCPGDILYLDGKVYGVVIKAKEGTGEKAIASGTVSSAGPYRGYGNVVFVLSKGGYIYVYGGNDSLSVRAGDKITAGQELGRVGLDVKQGFPAAYFLVFRNGEAVDPAKAPRD